MRDPPVSPSDPAIATAGTAAASVIRDSARHLARVDLDAQSCVCSTTGAGAAWEAERKRPGGAPVALPRGVVVSSR
jgi:hypothetical protein